MLDIISNIETVAEKLERLLNGIPSDVDARMREGGEQIVGVMQEYPPETDANRPPPPYYQRGVGKVLLTKILRTSGQMGERWQIEQRTGGGTTEVEITNNATNPLTGRAYPSYVHGRPYVEQATFHTLREWPSLLIVGQNIMGDEAEIVYSVGNTVVEEIESDLENYEGR